MPSDKPTDELLAALPQVGLSLNCLQQKASGDPTATWYAMLRSGDGHEADLYHGWGSDPASALVQALRSAGVSVTDE